MTLETAQELATLLEKAEAETSDPKELAQIGMMLLWVGHLIEAKLERPSQKEFDVVFRHAIR